MQIVRAFDRIQSEAGVAGQAVGSGADGWIIDLPSLSSPETDRAVRDWAAAASKAGARLILQADPGRFAHDHPLVAANPNAFALRSDGAGSGGVVDPRKPMPLTGEARARFRDPARQAIFADMLAKRLAELAAAGLAGMRLAAGSLPPALFAALRQQLAQAAPGFLFIAGPAGGDRAGLLALGETGCDYLVTSLGWWDGAAPWLLEELNTLSRAGQLLHELPADTSADQLALAQALGGGVILPAGSEWAVQPGTDALTGPLLRLSSGADPVLALLRTDGADLRMAERAELILVNGGAGEQVVTPALLSAAGARFTAGMAPVTLAAAEVRRVALSAAEPIVAQPPRTDPAALAAMPRLVLEAIEPVVDGGAFAAKRVAGEEVTVTATLFGDGHEQLAAELLWRTSDAAEWQRVPMEQLPNDRWRARFPLTRMGRHVFAVEGWLDRWGGFRRDFRKKVDAGVAQPVDHAEGRVIVAEAIARMQGTVQKQLAGLLPRLEKANEADSVTLLLSDELAQLMATADDRPFRITSAPALVDAERVEAGFSSWYEIFPRSITDDKARHGTFADVIGILPHVRDMGFDTLYFPPIHPIGTANRKGPNNTLTPGPDDVGSPYAIGSPDGGHDALHPELGTFADFRKLVAAAHDHGLEIALDFAIQCSPDHPWLKEHPGWFAWRPDGSMKYAENPPKKYQDIVNVDFYAPDAIPGLWVALRDVILLWVAEGVKTFRVDNPHTKTLPFWEWMIGEVRSLHPEVIFLSEAFTRPTMMYRLAKVGFSQSYTYFTWRDRKAELIEYIEELTTTAPKEFYRPHFFVNTPDINPHFLQTGGRPAHRIRAVLAATLSGLWGVYSGFELCDAAPLGPGKEEYLDSEKYEIRPYQARRPGDIVDDVTLLNRLRRAHPALQTHLNTRFYAADDEHIIWYGKPAPNSGDQLTEMIMVMVNMDPHNAHGCTYEVPLWQFGLPDHGTIAVEDLAHGNSFHLHGKSQTITLTPDEPYRIWRFSLPKDAL
ncbi:maltotransferase domain-containing protein [Croceibacterium ferulae]|uniref:maltotransferase domain-containing protein n=1 Tax=Croceibacterium ferulae TaxID=1854641 RepID=UPI0019D48969|nr:maltotransferase domain-containing protein [Croceibacterium ferulae]